MTGPIAGISDGERVELVRGNGLREGDSMGFATVTLLENDGIRIDAEGTGRTVTLPPSAR